MYRNSHCTDSDISETAGLVFLCSGVRSGRPRNLAKAKATNQRLERAGLGSNHDRTCFQVDLLWMADLMSVSGHVAIFLEPRGAKEAARRRGSPAFRRWSRSGDFGNSDAGAPARLFRSLGLLLSSPSPPTHVPVSALLFLPRWSSALSQLSRTSKKGRPCAWILRPFSCCHQHL